MSLVLASASPARLATLRNAGVEPRVVVSGVDESQVEARDPATMATRLAELKAEAVTAQIRADEADEADDDWVLGCDSVLELDGEVLGKPADAAEARRWWRAMRGRSGVLHTGHCLVDVATGRRLTRGAATTVHFAMLTDREVDAYVATGEPLHVAGAFTIDGLGGPFVREIAGDPHNVVGLSLPLVREMFAELGVEWFRFWTGGGS